MSQYQFLVFIKITILSIDIRKSNQLIQSFSQVIDILNFYIY